MKQKTISRSTDCDIQSETSSCLLFFAIDWNYKTEPEMRTRERLGVDEFKTKQAFILLFFFCMTSPSFQKAAMLDAYVFTS